MPYRMRLWVLLTGCLLLLPLFAADPPNDRLETQLARALSVTLLPEGKVTQVTAATPASFTFTSSHPLEAGRLVVLAREHPEEPSAARRWERIGEAVVTEASFRNLATARVLLLAAGVTLQAGQPVCVEPEPAMVGVLHFTRPDGGATPLGHRLAERLAPELQQQVAGANLQVLEPFRLEELLASRGLTPVLLLDPARRNTEPKTSCPLQLAVAGTVEVTGGQLIINTRIVDTWNGRLLQSTELTMPATTKDTALYATAVAPPAGEPPVVNQQAVLALKGLLKADPLLQAALQGPQGPSGPPGPQGSMPPQPPLQFTPEQAQQLLKLLDNFGPIIAELRGEVRALSQRVGILEHALAQ